MQSDLTDYEKVLSAEPKEFGRRLSRVFRFWRTDPQFSCAGFLKIAETYLGPACGTIGATAKAAFAMADERSANGYHNHHHNREVLALTLAILARHRAEAMKPAIGHDAAWLTLIAAAVHDYRHDGTSNKTGGKLEPMRLEKLALESCKDALVKAGLSQRDWLRLSMLVLPTDVNASSQPSPSQQLKDIYAYNSGHAQEPANVNPLFFSLLYDHELAVCAEILSDADLGVSAGLDHAMLITNAMGLAIETRNKVPCTAAASNFFLTHICRGFPGSAAGRVLLYPGFQTIKGRVQENLDIGLSCGMG